MPNSLRILIAVTLILLVAPAFAGKVPTGPGTVTGDATGTVYTRTRAANYDEPHLDNNDVSIALSVHGMGVVDKLLPLGAPTAGVTEYTVYEVNLANDSSEVWADYHLQLGWLVNNEYVPSLAGDGLDFDWGSLGPSNTWEPTSSKLMTIVNNVDEDVLDFFSSGPSDVVEAGDDFSIRYSIDIPDPPPSVAATHVVIRQFATLLPEGLAADFDEDGDVDGDDLARWQAGYSLVATATHGEGDADGDCDVDGRDFLTWQREFGSHAASVTSSSAVPEPTSVSLSLLTLMYLAINRPRFTEWIGDTPCVITFYHGLVHVYE